MPILSLDFWSFVFHLRSLNPPFAILTLALLYRSNALSVVPSPETISSMLKLSTIFLTNSGSASAKVAK